MQVKVCGRGLGLQPIGCTPALSVTRKHCYSCSMWLAALCLCLIQPMVFIWTKPFSNLKFHIHTFHYNGFPLNPFCSVTATSSPPFTVHISYLNFWLHETIRHTALTHWGRHWLTHLRQPLETVLFRQTAHLTLQEMPFVPAWNTHETVSWNNADTVQVFTNSIYIVSQKTPLPRFIFLINLAKMNQFQEFLV